MVPPDALHDGIVLRKSISATFRSGLASIKLPLQLIGKAKSWMTLSSHAGNSHDLSTEDLVDAANVHRCRIGLDGNALDLAVLGHDGEALAAVVAKQAAGVEGQIERLDESTGRVSSELDL